MCSAKARLCWLLGAFLTIASVYKTVDSRQSFIDRMLFCVILNYVIIFMSNVDGLINRGSQGLYSTPKSG